MKLINAMSVDVEDYFQTEAMSPVAPREGWDAFTSHVEANTSALFDLFAQYDVKATFSLSAGSWSGIPSWFEALGNWGTKLAVTATGIAPFSG